MTASTACPRGFSLVEMSIVLVVLGLILSALASPLAAQIEAGKIRETRAQLREIREALLGFALMHGRLPCPADPASGSELLVNGRCTQTGGALPWVDLGVKGVDAWGSRFSYQVAGELADTDPLTVGGCMVAAPAGVSFSLCAQGDIQISDGEAFSAVGLPAVVISHGANRRGAFDASGQLIAVAEGLEAENANFDALIVNRPLTEINGEVVFDDLLEWLPMPLLMARMVAAGKLP